MKNFEKGLSKTVAAVYTAQPSRQSIAYPRIAEQYVCASSRGATLDKWRGFYKGIMERLDSMG
ncbi:MAG: hypothetical protein WC568_06175 [Candidatus Methanoperedens sp.]